MSRKNENKKGANGAGSIRKITTTRNGKEYTYWQGRYTEGYDACTGKQIQRSITGKTQKEVAQKLRQITAEIDAKTYVAPCKLSISEWMSIWAQDYLVGVKASTAYLYRRTIELYIGAVDKVSLRSSLPTKKDAHWRHPAYFIILFRFNAVADKRQWSSAASKPRRKTRAKLCSRFCAENEPSHQTCRSFSASR